MTEHRHSTPALIVQVSEGRALGTGTTTSELTQPGKWAWFQSGEAHQLRNVGEVRVEFVEVEVRRPSP